MAGTKRTCIQDECGTDAFCRGYCRRHYKEWYKINGPRCSIPWCDAVVEAKTLCATHRSRQKKHGDPLYVRPQRVCDLPDCDNPHYGLGLCEVHYARQRRHGGLEDMRAFRLDPDLRFWPRVVVGEPEECWLWTGPPNDSGYGTFGALPGRTLGAHVYSLISAGVDIPDDWQVDHLCKVRMCVNPGHLEPVTAKENNLRSDSVSSKNARKTHCIRGHEFTEENTMIKPNGRACRACHRARMREAYRKRKKAEMLAA